MNIVANHPAALGDWPRRKTKAQRAEETIQKSKGQQVLDLLHMMEGHDAVEIIYRHLLARHDLTPEDLEVFSDHVRREAWRRERES